ncbi:hypothetical protein [Pelosinus sp. IPA-1]|uniref:hypothetical protein n=1 Tax=Pelosinus sp. IPA-1 TaxID=3029569 RepID=UPI00243614CA|nr:hypothetical protein [Pelosinus sp. IPA-1]GMA97585.1 hypothetical protein PIPA1_03850 [Pelosinus sp. IPA-1]
MEISKVPQTPGPGQVESAKSTNVQVEQDLGVSSSNPLVQKDFQVKLEDIIKNKLTDLTTLLGSRDQRIGSLPEDIKKIVQEILQQMTSTKDVAQGMEHSLNTQKNIAEQLTNLANILEIAATLQKGEYQDVQSVLKRIAEMVRGQAEMSPDQLANQLSQLVKQLNSLPQNTRQAVEQFLQQLFPESGQSLGQNKENTLLQLTSQLASNTSLPQGELKQVAKQLLQQLTPENLKQLSQNDKNSLVQLTKLLEKNMPSGLQQSSVVNQMPDLPEVWTLLQTIDAQQFKGIPPKVLEQTATTLQELYQEMKASPDKAAVAAKLENFVQNLPPELGKAVQQAIKQGVQDNSVLTLIKSFGNAALLNGQESKDVETFMAKLAENPMPKSLAAPAADLLAQVAKQLSETTLTIEQLKTLMKQIQNQLLSPNDKLIEKAQPGLEQLTKAVEQNIPQALQDMATKNKLPELSKMWVLLKAAGGEPYQNSSLESLQKSAGSIKELAQSLYKSLAGETEKLIDHKSLSFSLPLYFADGTRYPAHIHIYQQEKENSNQVTKKQFETWMRVSLDTENIGIVDSVFRLYEENKLDLRVIFPDSPAVSEFTQTLPEIRKSIDDTTLKLTNIMINKI